MKKLISLALILMFVPVITFSSEQHQGKNKNTTNRNVIPGKSSVNAPHSTGGRVPYGWPSVGSRHSSGGMGVYHGGYSGGSGSHYGYHGGGSYHGGGYYPHGGYYHHGWGYSYPWWSLPAAIVGLALVDGFLFGYPALYGYPGPYTTVPPPPQYAGPMPGYWQWIPENGIYVWVHTQ